jgi:hypothetical protein
MADKIVSAVMLAIQSKTGSIRDLSWENQCLVAKAIQILRALPERFDEVKPETSRDGVK